MEQIAGIDLIVDLEEVAFTEKIRESIDGFQAQNLSVDVKYAVTAELFTGLVIARERPANERLE